MGDLISVRLGRKSAPSPKPVENAMTTASLLTTALISEVAARSRRTRSRFFFLFLGTKRTGRNKETAVRKEERRTGSDPPKAFGLGGNDMIAAWLLARLASIFRANV